MGLDAAVKFPCEVNGNNCESLYVVDLQTPGNIFKFKQPFVRWGIYSEDKLPRRTEHYACAIRGLMDRKVVDGLFQGVRHGRRFTRV
jgi:hypothetical protein